MDQPGLKRCAVICVLTHGAEYLLLLRAREPNRGLYTPLGGKLDPFESPRAAAIREIREEAGITVDQVQFAGTLVESSPTAYNWWSAVYAAAIPRVDPPECPEGRLEWITGDRLATIPTPATDRHIYDFIRRGQPFAFSADYDGELTLLSMHDELSGLRIV